MQDAAGTAGAIPALRLPDRDEYVARYWRKLHRFVVQRILHADDTPHRIALGVAVAMLVAFLPLIGIQTVVAVGIAAMLRANKAVCVPIVWITNPFTFIPVYSACLSLGRAVTPASASGDPSAELVGLAGMKIDVLDYQSWTNLFHLLVNLGKDLWVGCIIVGITLAIPSYFFARSFVTTYRRRHHERLEKRKLRRARVAMRRTKTVGCRL